MFWPVDTRHRLLFHLVAGIWLVGCVSNTLAYTRYTYDPTTYHWSGQSSGEMEGLETIVVDMKTLRPDTKATLKLDGPKSPYVFLRIHGLGAELSQPCTQNANRLELHKDDDSISSSLFSSATLVCGNELSTIHTAKFPFTLVFTKGSAKSSPQLDIFNISIIQSTSFPSREYDSLNVSPAPSILYSPLFPGFYPNDVSFNLSLQVAPGYGVYLQLRFSSLETPCSDDLQIRGSVGYQEVRACDSDQMPYVLVPRSYLYKNGISLWFHTDFSVREQGLQLEYRSVKIGPTSFSCSLGEDTVVRVNEATFMSYQLRDVINGANCSVTFKAKPSQVLVLTSLLSGDGWSNLCGSVVVTVSIGNNKLWGTGCDRSVFGVIRAPPGHTVKLTFEQKYAYQAVRGQFNFLVEAYDGDAMPDSVTSHPLPSYIWTQGYPIDHPLRVRSPAGHCTEFSTLKDDLTPSIRPLISVLTLYSGSGATGNFELTRDCVGKMRPEKVINNGRYPLTSVAASKRGFPFWLNITEIGSTPCQAPSTFLDVGIPGQEISLFGLNSPPSPGVNIKKHMSCKFVLPPNVPFPGTQGITKFRGNVTVKAWADLFVTEDKDAYHVMASLKSHDRSLSSDWFSSPNILYIHFLTGSDVTHYMATFIYKNGYPFQHSPACPGPQEIVVQDAGNYRTPNYPDHLQTNMTCTWKFKRPLRLNNRYLQVTLEEDIHISCFGSTKLYIKEASASLSDSLPVCGSGSVSFNQVFHGDVDIVIKGGANLVVKGMDFHVDLIGLDYESKCNKSYEITDGSHGLDLSGQLHNGRYLMPFICQIHLFTSDHHHTLTVHLKDVGISHNYYVYDCYHDNGLFVYDGPTKAASPLIHTCYNNDESVTSSSNHVLIVIQVLDQTAEPATFDLSITRTLVAACNGEPTTLHASEDSQYFTSENFPGDYEMNSHCSWVIYSSTGHQVEIEIMEMDVEYTSACTFDYLQVFDGPNTMQRSLGKMCGRENSKPRFRSSHLALAVKFVSDHGGEGKGFRVRFYTQREPSPGLGDDDDSDDGNKTGTIIGACLSAIVGVFGIGFLCVWLVHKKRIRDMRGLQRRRREEAAFHRHSGQESSVYVINPLIVNNAPPPPYAGLINQGFLEEPPPSYRDALSQLAVPPPTGPPPMAGTTPGRAPPPPYSVSVPRGHEAISEDEDAGVYDHPSLDPDDAATAPIYQALNPLGHTQRDLNQEHQHGMVQPPPTVLYDNPVTTPATGTDDLNPYSLAREPPSHNHDYSAIEPPSHSHDHSAREPPSHSRDHSAREPPSHNPNHSAREPPSHNPNHSAREPPSHNPNHSAREPPSHNPNHSAIEPPSHNPNHSARDPPSHNHNHSAREPPSHNPNHSAREPRSHSRDGRQARSLSRETTHDTRTPSRTPPPPHHVPDVDPGDVTDPGREYVVLAGIDHSKGHVPRERTSRSLSDGDADGEYSLATPPGHDNRQAADYSLARVRSNSETCTPGRSDDPEDRGAIARAEAAAEERRRAVSRQDPWEGRDPPRSESPSKRNGRPGRNGSLGPL